MPTWLDHKPLEAEGRGGLLRVSALPRLQGLGPLKVELSGTPRHVCPFEGPAEHLAVSVCPWSDLCDPFRKEKGPAGQVLG